MSKTQSPPRGSRAKQLTLRWAPAVVWMGAIFAVSSIPGSNLPGGYSFQGHFGEYAVLGILVTLALSPGPIGWRRALLALAVCSLYGMSDEIHQAFVPGRQPDVLDWATDTAGAAFGIALTVAWLRWRAGGRSRPR
jgi:hypothetical protein